METTSRLDGTRRWTPAAERVLTAASELFYRQGLGAVGVETIAEAAGVTKKTLYDRFGSKAQLVAAYLSARDRRWRDHLVGYVDAHGANADGRLLAVFDALGEWMRAENSRGCAFVHAYAELTDPDHPGRRVTEDQKRWLVEYLTRLARDAGVPDPGQAAAQMFLLHEGATVAYGMGVDVDAAATARAAAVGLLGRQLSR
ncbi:MAG: TetR/AcrR family transcriptional regulator [Streptosporangiales bacterium]